jgi:signal transduction histidine kinase
VTSVAAGQRPARTSAAPFRWLARMLRDVVFVVSGVPVQLAGLAAIALPWLIPQFVPVRFWLVLAALGLSAILALLARAPLTFIQRHRVWSVLGVDIPPPPAMPGRSRLDRAVGSLRAEATWRQLAYHLVIGPILGLAGVLTLVLLAGGIELTGTYALSSWSEPLSAAQALSPKTKTFATATGVLLLVAVPAAAALITWLDRMAAAALLGPSRQVELERRVATLSQSRAGVVDAADAERRRIERDLHDGAQQRLVSLAMNLGLAREGLTDLPPEARQVIAAAHDEAKEALAELRNLIRGLHPAVLEDRGLDAALSGIAARTPLPVRLTVDMSRRASPTVEAVAYFVVSECLTNVARHSGARQATVDLRQAGPVLRIHITDDGTGGADPARGTGLASLAQRARSVDGSLIIDSPAGGPTVIDVELPCES